MGQNAQTQGFQGLLHQNMAPFHGKVLVSKALYHKRGRIVHRLRRNWERLLSLFGKVVGIARTGKPGLNGHILG